MYAELNLKDDLTIPKGPGEQAVKQLNDDIHDVGRNTILSSENPTKACHGV